MYDRLESLRPLKDRIGLLRDFQEAHIYYTEKTIYYAMRFLGLERDFDFDKTFVKFTLTYRPSCQDNPSLAFSIDNVEFLPHSQVPNKILEDSRPRRNEQVDMLRKMTIFRGLMLVVYEIDQQYAVCCSMAYMYMHAAAEKAQKILRARIGDGWLQDLRRMINYGIVFRTMEENDAL